MKYITSVIITISIIVFLLLISWTIFWFGFPDPWRVYRYNKVGEPDVYSSGFEQAYNGMGLAAGQPYFMMLLQGTDQTSNSGGAPFQVRLDAFTANRNEVDWSVVELAVNRGNGEVIRVGVDHADAIDKRYEGEEIVVSPNFSMFNSGVWKSGYCIDLDSHIDSAVSVIVIINYSYQGLENSFAIEREFRAEIRTGKFQPRH